MTSSAIDGTNFEGARSFGFDFTTSQAAAAVAIEAGSYMLSTTFDCWVGISRLSTTRVTSLAAVNAQPAVGSPNNAFKLLAGTYVPLDISPGGSYFISAIGVSASGRLEIDGPIKRAPVA